MLQFSKRGIKWLKCVHLLAACCWVGGALALAVLNLHNKAATSDGMLYGINSSGHMVDIWIVIVGGAMGCFVSGLCYALFTPWGFFRHRWLIVKWVITIAAILSGTFFLGEWENSMLAMSQKLGLAALQAPEFISLKNHHLFGGLVQIAVLVLALIVSVFKPFGRFTNKV